MSITLQTLPSSSANYKIVPTDLKDFALQRLNNKFNTTDAALLAAQSNFAAIAAAITKLQAAPASSSGLLLEDTHANRLLNYPASKYPVGSVFLETDLKIFLVNQLQGQTDSAVPTWTPAWAANPVSTRVDRQDNYFAFFWPNGTPFFETDTDLIYTAQALTYTVTVSGGTTVSFTPPMGGTGIFDPRFVQYPVGLGAFNYQVAAVLSPTVITLASPAPDGLTTITLYAMQWTYSCGVWVDLFGKRPSEADLSASDVNMIFTAADIGFTEKVGATASAGGGPGWLYVDGLGTMTLANMLALVLAANEVGIPVYETDYAHTHRWNGTAWEFSRGDTNQYVVEADQTPSGPVATVAVWYPCDGASHDCVNGDGTIRSVPTQNCGVKAAVMTGGFVQAMVSGSPPTWSATTSTGGDSASQTVQSGAGATVPAEPHTHQFATGGAAAPINVPSETNGGLSDHYLVSKWLRA